MTIKRFHVRDGYTLDEHPTGSVVRYDHHIAAMAGRADLSRILRYGGKMEDYVCPHCETPRQAPDEECCLGQRVKILEALAEELATLLHAEIKYRYCGAMAPEYRRTVHPALWPKYVRDMEDVRRAFEILGKEVPS